MSCPPMGLMEEWNLFKKTWVYNDHRKNIICKEDREAFDNFDNFISSKIWENDAWMSQITNIIIFKDTIRPIKTFAGKKIICICYSPFTIKSQKNGGKKTPVTFLLQDIIDKLIECLAKSNPKIKIQHCTRYDDEYNLISEHPH